jgi:hypothetical protein
MKNQMTDFPTIKSKDGTMVVSFYPVKTPFGDVSEEWCLQVLEWDGIETMSKKYLNRVEKLLAIRDRVALGYVFVKDNTNSPQLGNPFYGAV